MEASLAAHLDLKQLAINVGDAVPLEPLLSLFITSSDECVEELEEALRHNNVLSWHHIAHKLKGAALSVTARRMAELCREAETIRALPHEQAEAVLYHLQKEANILRAEIERVTLPAMPR